MSCFCTLGDVLVKTSYFLLQLVSHPIKDDSVHRWVVNQVLRFRSHDFLQLPTLSHDNHETEVRELFTLLDLTVYTATPGVFHHRLRTNIKMMMISNAARTRIWNV